MVTFWSFMIMMVFDDLEMGLYEDLRLMASSIST
jgi:hypothetical protein